MINLAYVVGVMRRACMTRNDADNAEARAALKQWNDERPLRLARGKNAQRDEKRAEDALRVWVLPPD